MTLLQDPSCGQFWQSIYSISGTRLKEIMSLYVNRRRTVRLAGFMDKTIKSATVRDKEV